jgi:hypothetical protein
MKLTPSKTPEAALCQLVTWGWAWGRGRTDEFSAGVGVGPTPCGAPRADAVVVAKGAEFLVVDEVVEIELYIL